MKQLLSESNCLMSPIELSDDHPNGPLAAQPIWLAKGRKAFALLYHPAVKPVVIKWYTTLPATERPQSVELATLVRYVRHLSCTRVY